MLLETLVSSNGASLGHGLTGWVGRDGVLEG
jgi:hypothetical protein